MSSSKTPPVTWGLFHLFKCGLCHILNITIILLKINYILVVSLTLLLLVKYDLCNDFLLCPSQLNCIFKNASEVHCSWVRGVSWPFKASIFSPIAFSGLSITWFSLYSWIIKAVLLCSKVNGQDMQEASHPEAVSVLKNAGSCVKIRVLRERCVPIKPQAHKKPDAMATERQSSQEWDVTANRDRSYAPQSSYPTLDSRLLEICNGNKSVGFRTRLPKWNQKELKKYI